MNCREIPVLSGEHMMYMHSREIPRVVRGTHDVHVLPRDPPCCQGNAQCTCTCMTYLLQCDCGFEIHPHKTSACTCMVF